MVSRGTENILSMVFQVVAKAIAHVTEGVLGDRGGKVTAFLDWTLDCTNINL